MEQRNQKDKRIKIEAIILIFLTIIVSVNSYGQRKDSLKCNISIVSEANNSGEKISEDLMLRFLKTFGKDCRNNAEFTEFSNKTLFKVIQKNPEKFVKILNNNLSKIDFNEVLINLRNPIEELTDIELIIKKIAATKADKLCPLLK